MTPHDALTLIKRVEETEPVRDRIGNFESQHCASRWDASLYRPVVDEFLAEAHPEFRQNIVWPEGKEFAALLSHDVDTAQVGSRREMLRAMRLYMDHEQDGFSRFKHLSTLAGLRRSPARQDLFTPWIEAEARYGFTSTFYFFPTEVRRRHMRDNTYRWTDFTEFAGENTTMGSAAREIARKGWEVGLHGSFLSATDAGMIAEQKADVEQACGQEVVSIRQHNLHFDARISPRIFCDAGLQSDSSMGSNRDAGFRAGTSYPFPLWSWERQEWLNILEIPLSLHDGALLRADNLDLDAESAYQVGCAIIDRVRNVRGVVTLLWHPESYMKPGWFDLYVRLLDYINASNGWGTSARSIVECWKRQGCTEKLLKLLGSPLNP